MINLCISAVSEYQCCETASVMIRFRERSRVSQKATWSDSIALTTISNSTILLRAYTKLCKNDFQDRLFGVCFGSGFYRGPCLPFFSFREIGADGPCISRTIVTWLILPVVICLSQRLSHACLSINNFIRWNCRWLIKSVIIYLMITYYMDNRSNSRANTCVKSWLLRERMYLLDKKSMRAGNRSVWGDS